MYRENRIPRGVPRRTSEVGGADKKYSDYSILLFVRRCGRMPGRPRIAESEQGIKSAITGAQQGGNGARTGKRRLRSCCYPSTGPRSEERRVGKEGGSTCNTRWWREH